MILDPLSKLMQGNESDPNVVQEFLHILARWRTDYHIPILLIHHFRKRQEDIRGKSVEATIDEFSGSSLLSREPDSIIMLDGKANGDMITMHFAPRHVKDPEPFVIKRGEDLW